MGVSQEDPTKVVSFRVWPDGQNATVLHGGSPCGMISWGPNGRRWKPPSSIPNFDVDLLKAIVSELESK